MRGAQEGEGSSPAAAKAARWPARKNWFEELPFPDGPFGKCWDKGKGGASSYFENGNRVEILLLLDSRQASVSFRPLLQSWRFPG